jgi:hypothetical protein
MNDPIVDEVRRVRDAHAAQFNYDLDAIFADIKEQEQKSGLTFISYSPRRIEPNQVPPPAGGLPVHDSAKVAEALPAAEL